MAHLDRYKLILINRNVRVGKITEEEYDLFLRGEIEISYIMNASSMKNGNYYCLSYPRNDVDTFEQLKIVNSRRSKSNIFAIEDKKLYEQSDLVVTTLKKTKNNPFSIHYLLGILNSRLYYHWFYHYGKKKGENFELFQKPITETKIKIPNDIEKGIVEAIVYLIIDQAEAGDDYSFLEKLLNGVILEIHYPEEFETMNISIIDELTEILNIPQDSSENNNIAAEPEPALLYGNLLSKLKQSCSPLIEIVYTSESDTITSLIN